ncbi:SixA phosphatase family protein [Streptomyces sp. NPDC002403]
MPRPAPARLIVLRHAKSAWPDGVLDHQRPLAGRGRRDAPAVGRRLHDAKYVPDLVICSTARRTRQTWDLVAAQLGASPEVVFEPRVYEASASTLVAVLRDVRERQRTVLLIGHQPGVQDLVLSLAGGGEAESLARARVKYPTSAVAVLSPTGPSWSHLAPGTATLDDFIVPRGTTVTQ